MKYVDFLLTEAGFGNGTWGGAWITVDGQYLPLVNTEDEVMHHKHILEDYFPELDDMFYDLWDEDDEVYGEESVNYAMGKGWLRVRTQGMGENAEFNVQMTVKPSRAALKTLKGHLANNHYGSYFFDHETGEGGGNANGLRCEEPEELLRAISQFYFAV
jgi:hypothetical protein